MENHIVVCMKRSFAPSITSNLDGRKFMKAVTLEVFIHGNLLVDRRRLLTDTMASWALLELFS